MYVYYTRLCLRVYAIIYCPDSNLAALQIFYHPSTVSSARVVRLFWHPYIVIHFYHDVIYVLENLFRVRVSSNFIRDIAPSPRSAGCCVSDPSMPNTANVLCLFPYYMIIHKFSSAHNTR